MQTHSCNMLALASAHDMSAHILASCLHSLRDTQHYKCCGHVYRLKLPCAKQALAGRPWMHAQSTTHYSQIKRVANSVCLTPTLKVTYKIIHVFGQQLAIIYPSRFPRVQSSNLGLKGEIPLQE